MKYPQIHTGQVWYDSVNGDTITIDEVYASDPWNNGEWKAKICYTVSDGREPDVVDAKQFGEWVREYNFVLAQPGQVITVSKPAGKQEAHA